MPPSILVHDNRTFASWDPMSPNSRPECARPPEEAGGGQWDPGEGNFGCGGVSFGSQRETLNKPLVRKAKQWLLINSWKVCEDFHTP